MGSLLTWKKKLSLDQKLVGHSKSTYISTSVSVSFLFSFGIGFNYSKS